MEVFFWVVAWILILLPVLLSLFTIFLMMTSKADDTYYLDEGFWPEKD